MLAFQPVNKWEKKSQENVFWFKKWDSARKKALSETFTMFQRIVLHRAHLVIRPMCHKTQRFLSHLLNRNLHSDTYTAIRKQKWTMREEYKKKKGNVHLNLLNIYISVIDNSSRFMLKNHVSKEVIFSNWHSQSSFLITG